jgi:L-asparagine transporter-like permease
MSKRNFGRLQFSQLLITTAIVHALILLRLAILSKFFQRQSDNVSQIRK